MTHARLALPGLGCHLRLPVPVPLAPPIRLTTCRPARPACTLFLSCSTFLPTFVTYLRLYPCPSWRRREQTKLRSYESQQNETEKIIKTNLTPPQLTPNHVFRLLLSHLFEHYNRGTGERNRIVRGCEMREQKQSRKPLISPTYPCSPRVAAPPQSVLQVE